MWRRRTLGLIAVALLTVACGGAERLRLDGEWVEVPGSSRVEVHAIDESGAAWASTDVDDVPFVVHATPTEVELWSWEQVFGDLGSTPAEAPRFTVRDLIPLPNGNVWAFGEQSEVRSGSYSRTWMVAQWDGARWVEDSELAPEVAASAVTTDGRHVVLAREPVEPQGTPSAWEGSVFVWSDRGWSSTPLDWGASVAPNGLWIAPDGLIWAAHVGRGQYVSYGPYTANWGGLIRCDLGDPGDAPRCDVFDRDDRIPSGALAALVLHDDGTALAGFRALRESGPNRLLGGGVYLYDGSAWSDLQAPKTRESCPSCGETYVSTLASCPDGSIWAGYDQPDVVRPDSGADMRMRIARFNGAEWREFVLDRSQASVGHVREIRCELDGSVAVRSEPACLSKVHDSLKGPTMCVTYGGGWSRFDGEWQAVHDFEETTDPAPLPVWEGGVGGLHYYGTEPVDAAAD